MIRSSSFLRASVALLLSVSLASIAQAQSANPSAGDLETARALVVKARELRDKGDYAAALEKYKAAHALAHTPITGIELAHTYAKLSMPVEARDVCQQVQRLPVGLAETERSAAARAEAVTLAEEMEKQAASLRIVLRYAKTALRPTVTVDAHEVPFEAISEALRVNPGKHEVTARIGEGKVSVRWVETVSGTSQEVALDVAAPPPKPSDAGNGSGPRDVPTHLSPLVPVGISVAGLGTVFGVLGGIAALKTDSDLRTSCLNKACPASVDIDATTTRAKTWATISTVGFGVAIVGGFVALYGFLNPVKDTPSRAPTVSRLRVQPTLGGLTVDGQF